jgi:MFS family permease
LGWRGGVLLLYAARRYHFILICASGLVCLAGFRNAVSTIPGIQTFTKMSEKLKAFLGNFRVLASAPRELWVVYAAYFCENVAYKLCAASVLTLWLSSDLGFGDKSAGTIVATWAGIVMLLTVLVGSLADALGVRRTFLLGFGICLAARTVMTLATQRWLALPFGLYLQAVGIALLIPVMTAACKKYSNATQRTVVFSLYYALMNLGFATGDVVFDRLRGARGLGEYGHWTLPLLGTGLSTYRVLMLVALVCTVPGLMLVCFFLREGVEMTETGVKITATKPSRSDGRPSLGRLWRTCSETLAKTVHIFADLWRQPAFYRFLIFMSLAAGVRMIFFHLFFTFPKYGIRELGEGAPFAHLSGILNSMLIVVLVPICGVLTRKSSAYRMVMVGSSISALSVFFIALPPQWFRALGDGWLGDIVVHRWLGVAGPVNPLYISMFLFVVMLSVGEALWSPRLYEYAAAVAPRDQEASYMALSLLPMFLAKFLVGILSGWLLATFCPAQGPRHPEIMWFLIGLMALITPVGTFLLRKQIQVPEAGREPVILPAETVGMGEE